jgi:membrane-associated phospholipid phosphatase
MGFWDGGATASVPDGADELTRLMRLDPFPRASVLATEGTSLFTVRPGARPAHLVRAESDLVSLTPPLPAKIAEQMAELRSAMDLRADRLPEIIAQSDGFSAFFAAQMPFGMNRRPYTVHLIGALHDSVVAVEQRMKHLCSVPRPFDLSPQIQPIISTPGHSAYPSGHATEAFAHATILAALRLSGSGTPDSGLIDAILAALSPAAEAAPVTDPVILLYRLAARIADNRTVAGVHYPVDSAHGALLGFGVTLAFISHCLGGGPDRPVPEWAADANDWSGDFTLRKWCAALGSTPQHGWRSGTTTVAKAEPWQVLPLLWKAAQAGSGAQQPLTQSCIGLAPRGLPGQPDLLCFRGSLRHRCLQEIQRQPPRHLRGGHAGARHPRYRTADDARRALARQHHPVFAQRRQRRPG